MYEWLAWEYTSGGFAVFTSEVGTLGLFTFSGCLLILLSGPGIWLK